MSLITCENLTLAYDTGVVASGIHFALEAGSYLCIVGENGSGKSTLLKAMLGLHPGGGGKLTIDPEARRRGVGYLPQHTPAQRDFPASVREIVRSGCLKKKGMNPFWSVSHKRMAEAAMIRMGIDRIGGKCYRELSGGQQQRVLLARAFCATGDLILLDEPIAGLDPMAMTEMYGMIADLNREGVAVVMVSHDVSAAVSYATHILHMGKTTAFFGTTEEYLATPVGKEFARRERGSYGDWTPKTAWDAPGIGKILDFRAAPDARSVLGARGVSRDRGLTASRRRGGASERGGRDA